MKSSPANQCDLSTALTAADAFAGFAERFFASVPASLEESAQFAFSHFGEVIAAQTNLALGVELYLKCLAIRVKRDVIHTHDLLRLYDDLPAEVKTSLSKEYRSRQRSLPTFAPIVLEVCITSTPEPPAPSDEPTDRRNVNDLRGLLIAEKDAFDNWRYFFQHSPDGRCSLFRAQHARLVIAGKIVRDHVIRSYERTA